MTSSDADFETFDGLRLHASRRAPRDMPPRAGVVVVHGYGEHSGRYAALVDRLLAAGYGVSLFDLRGHGLSPGPRGYVRAFEDYLDDLGRFMARERAHYTERPTFLLGHSMGALIAAHWSCLDPASSARHGVAQFAGLILSGAPLKINERIHPWLQRLSGPIGFLAPRLPTVRLDERALSRDVAVVEQFRDDPLTFHGRMPARTGAEIVRASKRIGGLIERLTVPVLLMHGTADRLADPEGSRLGRERAASSDKTLKLYPGLYHEIFNEPEREQVFDDLVSWLAARAGD